MLVFFFSGRGQDAEKQAESRPLEVGMTFSRLIGLLNRYDRGDGAS